MKILQLTEHYLPFLGGVEMNVYELSRRLVKDGFDVEVICEKEPGTANHEIIEGVKVHRFSSFRIAKLRYDVGRIVPRMLLSAIKNDADIVHAHAYGYFPTYACIFSNKPTVITTHSDPAAKIYPFWDLSRSISLKLCNHVIATTQMEKLHLTKRGVNSKKITVVPNGITMRPLNATKRNNPCSRTILCLARLDYFHKGQDILLQAMAKVLSKIPDAKLWVVGAGSDLAKLKELTTRLKIGDSVEFKGRINEARKLFLLENCQVLCVSPRTESFGIIYLEAMACGLPIVTTMVGGIPEVVGDSALLVPPNDPSALADALIQVLTNGRLADNLSKKGLERAKQFDWDILVKKYEKLYEQIA
jgi:glycosyltransferase involved in cell wall biosynthesis